LAAIARNRIVTAADPLEPLRQRLVLLDEWEANALETLALMDRLEDEIGDDPELAARREAVKSALRTIIETSAQFEAFRDHLEKRLGD
jgi:hypothetical protein